MKLTPLLIALGTSFTFVTAAVAQDDERPDADNTAHNKEVQDGNAKTSESQSNEQSDIDLAAKTRRMVMADDSLSMAAKNAKIIAEDGRVTLRGPVDSQQEKTSLEEHARSAGATQVDNQLSVKRDKSDDENESAEKMREKREEAAEERRENREEAQENQLEMREEAGETSQP